PPFTSWDYGDGTTASGQLTTTHAYSKPGHYTVRVVTRDIVGCLDTIVKPLFMQVNGPVAGFIAPVGTFCANTPVPFTDTSFADASQPIVSWRWEYGDGDTESLPSGPFQHAYRDAGSYPVTLT